MTEESAGKLQAAMANQAEKENVLTAMADALSAGDVKATMALFTDGAIIKLLPTEMFPTGTFIGTGQIRFFIQHLITINFKSEFELSINYNSQSWNGILGIGWSLAGISSIARTGNMIYHDSEVDGIKFNSDDGFVLDGQRLILIDSDALQDEYRTEIESYSRIISYHNGNHNPQKFKVWTKNGMILEYGFTSNSSVEPVGKPLPYLWKINKMEDRMGNYIQFDYNEANGMSTISKISYSGNSKTGAIPEYGIVFDYTNREDINVLFVGGYAVRQNELLEKIRVQYDNTDIKN